MTVTERSVSARWEGGMRATVEAGGFEVVADEPAEAGGTGSAPQPTELLLASIASCFTLAMAYSARKRDVALKELTVDVTGRYAHMAFDAFTITVRTAEPGGAELERLVAAARRVCYVTRTLASPPEIEIVTG